MGRYEAAHPVRRAEEVAAVALLEELHRPGGGDPDVDGLAALQRETVETSPASSTSSASPVSRRA